MNCDLSNIKIVDTNLVNVNNYSSFYMFCINNNIKTLKDLFNYIKNNDVSTYGNEVCGVIELLKYKYLLNCNLKGLLYTNINLDEIFNKSSLYKKYSSLFLMLGFAPYEVEYIINYAYENYIGVVDVGELICSLNDLSLEDCFGYKIDLLSNLYMNNRKALKLKM